MNIVSVNNFSKGFHGRRVVHDLSFTLEPGEVFAFLGANGSGKTTTIRSLLGIYAPDEGDLLIKGQRYSPALSDLIGYLPEERGLYLDAQVLETIVYFGMLKGMNLLDAQKWGKKYLERVGLADKVKEKIKKLSSGQQQKIQLGVTLVNQPELLILDEPTKGLDPVNRDLLMTMLGELNKEKGTSILFSTHQMEEAEKIADKLLMIKDGRRRLYGPVSQVKAEFGQNTIILEFAGKLPENSKLYTINRSEKNYAELELKTQNAAQEVLKFLVGSGLTISKFEHTVPSLHQIFIQVSNDKSEE